MLLISLDEKNKEPIYKQIINQIIEKINSNALIPGDLLPSTRKLADMLDIHRATVSLAYQELWSLGYIELNPGICAKVRKRAKLSTKTVALKDGAVHWDKIFPLESNSIFETYNRLNDQNKDGGEFIDFSTLNMDTRMFPMEKFRICLNEIIKEQGAELFQYGDVLGYRPLREYIASHLENHGISVSAEQIFLTNGTQQAIDLILRMIGEPGKSIAVETPTYKEIIPLIKYHKLTPLEIPVYKNGMDLDILEEKIKIEKPVLIYTMPNFQNPTGVTTSQVHRERLLSICEKYKIPILEDGFEEEMKYFGKVVLPIKSMDKHNLVIYCSTFSKVLFPGIRIGWIAADKDCINRLAALRHFSEISLSMILQAAMYNFCSKGYYDMHISKLHRIYRKRMQITLNSLNKNIDKELAEWIEPQGGYFIWIRLKKESPKSLENEFKIHGIKVSYGYNYFFSDAPGTYFRLSISALSEDEIVKGIKKFGEVLSIVYK